MLRRQIDSFFQRVLQILNGNLKTINGQSVVGSGNITVGGGGATWGGITGTLSTQTDLQTALNNKENLITAGTTSQYFRGDKTFQTLDKSAVGLGSVDNTDDLSKPVSTLQAAAIALKQDTLVSGTNIKTLNTNTILGSGDITIDKTFIGLSNVDDTSDLNKPISTATQTALNAKQDSLILTTTGTSGAATLVGSTLNIPQYSGGGGGGGGLQGINNLFGYFPSGFGINVAINGSNNSTYVTQTNRIDISPFIPNKTITSVSLNINVTTLGAGVLTRILIYSDLNGQPDQKIYESTDIDCSTTGQKTITTTFTFNAGTTYWIGSYSNGAATLTGINQVALYTIGSVFASGQSITAWSRINVPLGSAPTTFNWNTYRNGTMPNIWIRV